MRTNLASVVWIAMLHSAAPAAWADAIHTGWYLERTAVERGATFDLEFWVTEPGLAFNAFDVTFEFDPAILEFVPASPIGLQLGSYMASACGNTFHLFAAGGDSLVVSLALLCSGVSRSGPGQIYRLRFRARDSLAVTRVGVRRLEFYSAGVFARPALHHDAVIRVDGPVLGVPADPVAGARLVAEPNPSRGVVRLGWPGVTPPVGARARILDVHGRVVRELDARTAASGSPYAWDGRDAGGRLAPPGLYWAVAHAAGRRASVRIIRVH